MPSRDSLRRIFLIVGATAIVAATYVTFGIVAFVAVHPSPHFLGYALMGTVVAIGAALTAPPAVG